MKTNAIFAAGPSGQTPSLNPLQRTVRTRILLPKNYQTNPSQA